MAPKQTTLLSPLDKVMPRGYISTALFFKSLDQNLTLSQLQDGLNKTCAQLPFLNGRVINLSSDRDRFAISWDPLSSHPPSIEEKSTITAIANATKRIDTNHIAEFVQLSNILPSLSSLLPEWDFSNGPDLSITSWTNLGLYDADYGDGVGKPSIVRIPYVPADRLVVILPRRRDAWEEEEIEVTVILREDDMERLGRDEAWRSWLVDGAD